MSFAKFFKDALLSVAVWTCGVLLSCFVLTVAGAPVSIVIVAVGVSFIFGMLGIVIEYARRRRFLHQLERAAEELESPAWVQEMVQCPTYAEGELEYEVLRRVGKAACDEVAEGRRQTDDYRDYIESWVHEAKLPLAALGGCGARLSDSTLEPQGSGDGRNQGQCARAHRGTRGAGVREPRL